MGSLSPGLAGPSTITGPNLSSSDCQGAKRMGRLCGVLLALLPLLTVASPSFSEDYSDYNDRIVINPGTDPLDYAAIYEGVFSYVVTTLAWGAVQAVFPPRLASRVKREGEEVEVINNTTMDIAALLHTVGDAVEKYSSKD